MNPSTQFAFFDVGASASYTTPPFKFNEVYDLQGSNEASLYLSIYNEFVYLYGTDIVYIERTIYDAEPVFGEAMYKVYTKGVPMRFFIEEVEGWGGQGDIYSKFGIQITDECTLFCPKITFEQYYSGGYPKYGDLIYVPKSRKVFEIKHIEDELPPSFYLLGNRSGYVISCKAFVYDNSEIKEGNGIPEEITALDKLMINPATSAAFDLIDSKEVSANNVKHNEIAHATVLDTTETDPLLEGLT